jgi:hypothetical protein
MHDVRDGLYLAAGMFFVAISDSVIDAICTFLFN